MVDSTRIFTDPTDVEPGFEPMMYSIPYPSGGVKVNGEALAPKAYNVAPEVLAGAEVQVGKKKFVRFE